jgi:cell division septation protein DedD
VLVVLTPEATESTWVEKEYMQALSLRKKVIPIMLVPSAIPFALNTINFINFAAGEYGENYRKLLEALDYKGEIPATEPFERRAQPFSQALRKFGIPIFLGILLLFAIFLTFRPQPVATPTTTSTPSLAASATRTHETATPISTNTTTLTLTPTPTQSSTPSATLTVTQTPTLTQTPLPTPTFRFILELCVKKNLDVYNIYVRSGPSQKYAPLGELLTVRDMSGTFKNVCLWFSARNENDDGIWFLVAPGQTDPALRQYEGGWILSDLLGPSPIELPLVTLTATAAPSQTSIPSNTPTLTPTATPTPTESPTLTPSATASVTPVPTDTPTP